MPFAYPPVRRDESQVDILHSVAIKDPYRHLEDPDAQETREFVASQQDLFQGYISSGKDVHEKIFKSLTHLNDYEKYGVPFKKGENYYYSHNLGLQPQSVLYTQTSLDSEPSVFFDPNTLSEDGTVSLASYSFSKSGKLFAYALSASGSDWVKIHVKEVGSGKDLEERPLEWAKFTGISFTHDEKGFFYNRYPAPPVTQDKAGTETHASTNQRVCFHRIGTPQDDDIVVWCDEEHPERMAYARVTDCGRYVTFEVNQSTARENLVYVADLVEQFGSKSCLGRLDFKEIVGDFKAAFDPIANDGSVFYFETTLDAPNKRIVKYDVAKRVKGFVEVVPESDVTIDIAQVVDNNKLILVYLRDVNHVMKVFDLFSGAVLRDINLDTGSIVNGLRGERGNHEFFYSLQTFISPGVIRRFDFNHNEDSLFRQTSIRGYDSSAFEVKQVFYPSEDGTKIPMFIFHKKGLVMNGENPTLLYAYGGFTISILPYFSPAWIAFIENFNGVVAVANIRGGSEYGTKWHEAGMLFNKQNCYYDFQHAARFLVKNHYTIPRLLAITGRSNGGLLVGACLNQTPELFALGIADVGVHDLLRFHKFTIGAAWVSDFGSPDVKEEFENILKISPLHNVDKTKPYPAILITTGDHDDRVVPLHSMKFAATLQHELKDNAQPIMMRVDTKAGHGAGKSIQQQIAEVADKYTFLSIALNIPCV
ncbi:prolyl endopeptidase [Chytriomyces sp. MP71]|nr:prolyl endopeptidase [Chytriomyces sp. MP71]